MAEKLSKVTKHTIGGKMGLDPFTNIAEGAQEEKDATRKRAQDFQRRRANEQQSSLLRQQRSL